MSVVNCKQCGRVYQASPIQKGEVCSACQEENRVAYKQLFNGIARQVRGLSKDKVERCTESVNPQAWVWVDYQYQVSKKVPVLPPARPQACFVCQKRMADLQEVLCLSCLKDIETALADHERICQDNVYEIHTSQPKATYKGPGPMNCNDCGRMFHSTGKVLCPGCEQKQVRQKNEIYDYLQANPGATVETIAEALKMPVVQLKVFFQQGEMGMSGQMALCKCSKCGSIMSSQESSTYFCKGCTQEVQRQGRIIPVQPVEEKPTFEMPLKQKNPPIKEARHGMRHLR